MKSRRTLGHLRDKCEKGGGQEKTIKKKEDAEERRERERERRL